MIGALKEKIHKQELLLKLLEELSHTRPVTKKEVDTLRVKIRVAKEEILKENFEIKKTLEEISCSRT